MADETIRILVVDDHQVVRQGLVALLSTVPDFKVVAEAGDGSEAVELHRELKPDITIMDLRLPRMSGVDAIIAIRAESPQARFIVLTTFDGDEDIYRALQAGAKGYLLKGMNADELTDAIRTVHSGGRAVDPVLAADAWGEPDPLTERERQVLRLAGDGLGNADISASLQLSEGTVRNYLSEAMRKLGAPNRTAAARLARERGWL